MAERLADDALLELDRVSKTIAGKTIVHPASFRLRPGRILALCGGNGAGKSTMLRMIAGILRPTAGTIRVDGVEWRRNRGAYAERIGYMPDDFRFGEALSALETLRFYAALRKVPEARVREALRLVGLEDAGKKAVSDFSKGMKQRLMFAQSVLAGPKLLLLDEPTNGMDPYWTDMFVSLLAGMRASGQTAVFSTHQLQVAEAVADEIVFLGEGRVLSAGPVGDFLDRYGSAGLHAAFIDLLERSRA